LFDNFDVDHFFSPTIVGFNPMFDMLTNSFKNFSPLYDDHFDFLSKANNLLSSPYPQNTIHIYVQNSIANNGGELETKEFECADGFPADLFDSCHQLKAKEMPSPETEAPVVEPAEEAVPVDDFIPSFLDNLFGMFGGAEIEEEIPDPETSTDSGLEAVEGPSEFEQEEVEDFSSPFGSMFHSMGCMFGHDDQEEQGREIPASPFDSLFRFFNELDAENTNPQEPEEHTFIFPLSPMKRLNMGDWPTDMPPRDDGIPSDQRIITFLPLLQDEATTTAPLATNVESENFNTFDFEDGIDLSSLANNRLLEGTILASLMLVLMFFGFRQGWCKRDCADVVEESPEETITTEEAKAQATDLPEDLQVNLIESDDDLDRPITPDEVQTHPCINEGDGI